MVERLVSNFDALIVLHPGMPPVPLDALKRDMDLRSTNRIQEYPDCYFRQHYPSPAIAAFYRGEFVESIATPESG